MGFTHPPACLTSPFTEENVLENALELLPCGDDYMLFPYCIPSCLVCPPLELGPERGEKTGLGEGAGGRGKVREKRPPGWRCSDSHPGAPRRGIP